MDNGATPLHMAAGNADAVENLQMLIEVGADIEARNDDGATPLHRAASESSAAVRTLVDAGADIMARMENGRTPLHQAAALGSAENVKALIEAGAYPDMRAWGGSLPADLAEENDRMRDDPAFMEIMRQSK